MDNQRDKWRIAIGNCTVSIQHVFLEVYACTYILACAEIGVGREREADRQTDKERWERKRERERERERESERERERERESD